MEQIALTVKDMQFAKTQTGTCFLYPGGENNLTAAVIVKIGNRRRGVPAGFTQGGITAAVFPFQDRSLYVGMGQ